MKILDDSKFINKNQLEKAKKLCQDKIVLMVDDDQSFLEAAEKNLNAKGESVISTTNIDTFFKLVGANSLKAVLIDCKSPSSAAKIILQELIGHNAKIGIISDDDQCYIDLPENIPCFNKKSENFIDDIISFVNGR